MLQQCTIYRQWRSDTNTHTLKINNTSTKNRKFPLINELIRGQGVGHGQENEAQGCVYLGARSEPQWTGFSEHRGCITETS